MNESLDQALRELASDPGPQSLTAVQDRILRQVAGYRFVTSDVLMVLSLFTITASLGLGIAGGWFDARPSAQTIAPLVGAHPLAPSSLLASE